MNSSPIKHAQVTVTTPVDEDTEEIRTESYYEKLANSKVELQRTVDCTKSTLLSTLIDATTPLMKENCVKVEIVIKRLGGSDAIRLTKRWTIDNQSFNRK